MAGHQQKLREPKLERQPPHGWFWESVANVWRRKTTVIAVFAAAAILAHLILRFGVRTSTDASRIPLLATLVLGGIPLLYQLLRELLKREFGSDLLGGISIVTSVLLGEYLAGSIIVLMLAEGRQFLAADINTRKQLLNATLSGLFVFDLIMQMLKQSASNEVDEAVVLSQLALTFPHERPQRVLRTVVAWARYAALFKYSSTRRVFHGLQQPATTA